MTKFRNYFIIFASVFAITAACAMQDVKAQDSMSDLIKRIEALESKPAAGGNVTAGKIRGLKIGLNLRHRYGDQEPGLQSYKFWYFYPGGQWNTYQKLVWLQALTRLGNRHKTLHCRG